MSTLTLSHVPVAAGGALAHAALRGGRWAWGRFMQAPLAYSSVIALSTFSLMAVNNALYWQPMRHPAPFFGVGGGVQQVAEIEPETAVPPKAAPVQKRAAAPAATKPMQAVPAIAVETDSATSDEALGNAEVFALQKKLKDLKLFTGKVDGYYGPMTARAIRAFEEAKGMKLTGALGSTVVNAIMNAPVMDMTLVQTPAPAEEPVYEAAADADVMSRPVEYVSTPVQAAPVLAFQPAPVTALVPPDPVAAPVEPAPIAPVQTAEQAAETIVTASLPAGPAPIPDAVMAQTTPDIPPALETAQDPAKANTELITTVQRGLASLGFLAGAVDGMPGEATAKAIRNFEVYYNYNVTGAITPELVGMLRSAGAAV